MTKGEGDKNFEKVMTSFTNGPFAEETIAKRLSYVCTAIFIFSFKKIVYFCKLCIFFASFGFNAFWIVSQAFWQRVWKKVIANHNS